MINTMRNIIIFLLFYVAFATPRTKRQTENAQEPFWWESDNTGNTGTLDNPINTGTIGNSETSDHSDNLGIRGNGAGNAIETIGNGDFNTHPSSIDHIPEGSADQQEGCNGKGTICVPWYQCDDNKRVITDGTGIIDIRSESSCPRVLEVCCKTIDITKTTTPETPYVPSCGHRNTEGINVRVDGFNVSQTQFGEYPWMVAILRVETIMNEELNLYLCGGSLIAPNIVLTAGHCVSNYDASIFKVRAGEWDTQSTYEEFPHEDRRVNVVIIHPEFGFGSLINDFAILVLDTPYDLSPHIDTVCLPNQHESFEGILCQATGWGKDIYGREGRFQNIMKQVNLKVISHDICERALQTTRLGLYFSLHSSFLCAGGDPGVDTCKGDGGSPLVCAKQVGNDIIYYQVGIVAWGIGCGEDGIPGIYADVTKVVNWINEVIIPYLIL